MKKTFSLLLAALIILSGFTVYAKNSNNEIALPDSEVVEEFDYRIQENDYNFDNIMPAGRISYKVKKLGVSSVIGNYTGQSVSGEPGLTISLSQMDSKTFSASSNITWGLKGLAEASLGFSFSASKTIKHSATITVPRLHNGRKVKRAEIKAYELYDKHDFKITWTSYHVKKPHVLGTYWAKNPSGYHYKVVYYYK